MGFLVNSLLQIYYKIFQCKHFFENRLKFDRIMAMSLWPRFFGPPCMSNIALIDVILCPYEAKLLKIKLCNVNTGCLRCMHVILSLITHVSAPDDHVGKLKTMYCTDLE